MPTTPVSSHIRIDERGVAWIDDSQVKVVEVVQDYLAYGWTPEEMHLHQPHLSLSQIYGAMSYYHDHKRELDKEIQRRSDLADTLQERYEDKDLRRKLQDAKRKQ